VTGERERRLHPNPDVVATRVGEETVLIHLGTDRVLSLNGTAARVWELVSAGCDRADLEQRLLGEYQVAAERLAEDLDHLLSTFREQGLVRADGA
jgi:hypothetical protein